MSKKTKKEEQFSIKEILLTYVVFCLFGYHSLLDDWWYYHTSHMDRTRDESRWNLTWNPVRYALLRPSLFNWNHLILSGLAQRPGWPNSQLPIRNLLLYDTQTWWLSFYPKDTFWPNFSKIDQSGGSPLLFSHWDVPKILKMKIFSSAWKLLKLTLGGGGLNFGSRRTILNIKTWFWLNLITLIFGIRASEPPPPPPLGLANHWKGRAW